MSAAVNDRPRAVAVPLHLPLTGELHPLRREFVRWLATGNVITITLAVVVCATIYFWPRPAPVVIDDIGIVDRGIVFSPPPIATGKNDVGYDVPAPKVDDGTFVIAPDDEIFKDPSLGRDSGNGDHEGVPGDEPGMYTGGWSTPDSILVPDAPAPNPEFNWWTEAPVMLSCQPPVYPNIVREAGIDGTVNVRVLIGVNGKVKDAYVLDGTTALREAALASARTAFFKPAMQGNHPVEVWVVIPITFTLRDGN